MELYNKKSCNLILIIQEKKKKKKNRSVAEQAGVWLLEYQMKIKSNNT